MILVHGILRKLVGLVQAVNANYMLLIGSRALIFNGISLDRKVIDWDFICTIAEYENFCNTHKKLIRANYPTNDDHMIVIFHDGDIFEFDIAWEGTSSEDILKLPSEYHPTICDKTPCCVANFEICLLLKLSHRYLKNSPFFHKTMHDIRVLRTHTKLSKEAKRILKKREKETYTYTHPKLNQSKNNFFDASVSYTYQHDDIHRAIAIGSTPAYEYFKDDEAEVFCSKSKFFSTTEVIRLSACLEESYVLAIERSLVPFPDTLSPKNAFLKALEKICTSITSGWFREYCWEHYDQIVDHYDDKYFEKFKNALSEGRIGLFQK
jgi:hypothetical protein